MNHKRRGASLLDRILAAAQYPLPHHLLSRVMFILTRSRTRWWKNALIHWFRGHFDVDMSQAVEPDPLAHASFNEFFTRALRTDARPLPESAEAVISPVDGKISDIGDIHENRIFQAKGHDFSLATLLGGDGTRSRVFENGCFATLYLSPRDYHRIHMPFGGQLRESIYVPGRLFSVAPCTVRSVPELFARNERLIALFDTEVGPMAVILVGALFVGCIETVWDGVVTPPHGHWVRAKRYGISGTEAVTLQRGDELGRFNMGSTVILLFGPDAVNWEDNLEAELALNMGQPIGQRHMTAQSR